MKFVATVVLFLALGLTLADNSSFGQSVGPCKDHLDMPRYMENTFKEYPMLASFTSTGRLMTMYARLDLETWSIVISYQNGLSCMVGSGTRLRIIDRSLLHGERA